MKENRNTAKKAGFKNSKEIEMKRIGKQKRKILFLIVIFCVFLPPILLAQTERWVYTYNGADNDDDRANDIIYAADGHLYTAGYSTENGPGVEFKVISISTGGIERWENGDGGRGTATALSYESYYEDKRIWVTGDTLNVSGSTRWRISVLEPSSGTSIWSKSQRIFGDTRSMSIVCGLDGNTYIAGFDGTHFNVNKCNSGPLQENMSWAWGFYLTEGVSKAYSVVYGSDNIIYSAGFNTVSTEADFTIVRNNKDNASENWKYYYNGSGSSDEARSVVYGSDGNLYAAGYSTESGTGSDFTIISIETSNTERWVYIHNGTANDEDRADALVYGSDGNIYAAGYSSVSGNANDFTVISVDNAGNERWVYTYNGTASGDDRAADIVYGSDGNIYAAGYSTESGTGSDFTVCKLDAAGNEIWVYTYDGGVSGEDKANALVHGSDGYTYAAGYSSVSGNSYDYTVISLEGGPTNIASPSFCASAVNSCVSLHWTVGMEDDCILYIIDRKAMNEDSDYSEIARIPGSGSSPSPKSYSYKDEDVEVGIRYYYKLGVVKTNGNTKWYGPVSTVVTATRPFLRVSPNPFTTSTTISFTLPSAQVHKSTGAQVEDIELNIYDISGRSIRTFPSSLFFLRSSVTWDGKDNNGKILPSGIYYCRLSQGSFTETRKVLFVR